MRILGVYFSKRLPSIDNDNWKCKPDKLQSVANLWSSRELSFIGRAMIVNMLHASVFGMWVKFCNNNNALLALTTKRHIYMTCDKLLLPKQVIDSYNSIVRPFIWKGKIEPVSRERYWAPVDKGGLNIVNFSVKCSSLSLSNFASLRDNFGTEMWHYLACYFLGNRLAKFDAHFRLSSNAVPSCSTP